MRVAFSKTLVDCARADERLFLLVGDVGYTVVEPFIEEFPDRFINVGVAEQNMTGIATGLALCGKVVFTYSIANFPTFRCLEHIRNDVCYHEANVKIVAVGGGLHYGVQGITHHATEDLAIMRALHNMTVVAPGDPVEAALATRAIIDRPGPCYLRLADEPVVHQTSPSFQIGKAITVREGSDVTLITTGGMLYNTMQAAEQLANLGIQVRVLSMHTLKPVDNEAVLAAARETGGIITIEEHSVVGGLGSAIAETLVKIGCGGVPVQILALPDSFGKAIGGREYLRHVYGLSIDDIRTATEKFYKLL